MDSGITQSSACLYLSYVGFDLCDNHAIMWLLETLRRMVPGAAKDPVMPASEAGGLLLILTGNQLKCLFEDLPPNQPNAREIAAEVSRAMFCLIYHDVLRKAPNPEVANAYCLEMLSSVMDAPEIEQQAKDLLADSFAEGKLAAALDLYVNGDVPVGWKTMVGQPVGTIPKSEYFQLVSEVLRIRIWDLLDEVSAKPTVKTKLLVWNAINAHLTANAAVLFPKFKPVFPERISR